MTAILHGLFALTVIAVAAAELRWIAAKSRQLLLIFAVGLAMRFLASVTLFVISSYDLNVLRGLHTGGGFWALALDAHLYYPLAAQAAAGSLHDAAFQGLSPSYVTALALWMRGTGISVLSAILFNCVCYMATAAAIVAGAGRSTTSDPAGPRAWVLAAFSLSPMLLLSSTQVLKDAFMAMLVAVAARGMFQVLVEIGRAVRARQLVVPVLVTAVAFALTAAVRAYYMGFLWIAAGAGVVTLASLAPARPAVTRARMLLRGTTVLLVLGSAGLFGAGQYVVAYADRLSSTGLAGLVEASRAAFVESGGATNLATLPVDPARLIDQAQLARVMRMPVSHKYDLGPFKVFLIASTTRSPVGSPDLSSAARQVTQGVRVAYFLPGWDPRAPDGTARRAVASALATHGIEVAVLPDEPKDAIVDESVLFVVGSAREMSHAELEATAAYLSRGGHVFRVIDADAPLTAPPVRHLAGLRHAASVLGTGLAATFVPMTVLEATSVVQMDGGRGLLLVADLDTIFLDASVVWLAFYLWRRRSDLGPHLPALVFTLVAAGICTLLLAYVVTNFGTLLRLRLLVAAPVWLAPLAIGRRIGDRITEDSASVDEGRVAGMIL